MSTETTEKKNDSLLGEAKKRAAAGAVAVFTSASMLVGGLFSPPADLPDSGDLIPQVIYSEDEDEDLTGGGDGSGGEENEDAAQAALPGEEILVDEERMGVRARRQTRSLALRILAVLPIWALCLGGAALLGVLLGGLVSPILAKLLAWLLMALGMLLAFVLSAKTLFPELPLKKILNRRSLTGLLIAALVLGAADTLLPLVWSGYSRVEALLRAGGGLLSVAAAVTGLSLRRRKEQDEQEPEQPAEEAQEEEEEEEERPLSREEILAMVDSVGKKR